MSEDLPLATSADINVILTQIFDSNTPAIPTDNDYGFLYKKTGSNDLFWLTQFSEVNVSSTQINGFGTATTVDNGSISILTLSNTRAGQNSLITLSDAINAGANTAFGRDSLKLLTDSTVSYANTVYGYRAGSLLTTANNTIFIGYLTGAEANTSENNICVGNSTLSLTNNPGINNIAVGNGIMSSIDAQGNNNIVVGHESFISCTIGYQNIAIGNYCLTNLDEGTYNICMGQSAGDSITSGNDCILLGNSAGRTSNGNRNIAIGSLALYNSTGSSNISIGYASGFTIFNGSNNINIGTEANVLFNNTSNTIVIGNGCKASSNQTRIGFDVNGNSVQSSTFIDGIVGKTVQPTDGIAVYVSSAGQLGTVASSRRYKDSIATIQQNDIDKLLSLDPVSFCYKNSDVKRYGLVAEDVYDIFPEMVVKYQDQIETVQYDQLFGLMLAAIKHLNDKVKQLMK